jgi:hypothetical protein
MGAESSVVFLHNRMTINNDNIVYFRKLEDRIFNVFIIKKW